MCGSILGLFPRFRFRARLGSAIIPFPASPHQTVRDLFDHTAFRQPFNRQHSRQKLESSSNQGVSLPQSTAFVPSRRIYACGTESAFRVRNIEAWKSMAGCHQFGNSWPNPSTPDSVPSLNPLSETVAVPGPPSSSSPSRRFSYRLPARPAQTTVLAQSYHRHTYLKVEP